MLDALTATQQEELERFEEQILHEKEGRKRALLEERRQRLAQAFHNDLRTYQTLVTYQGATAASALAGSLPPTSGCSCVAIHLITRICLNRVEGPGRERQGDARIDRSGGGGRRGAAGRVL